MKLVTFTFNGTTSIGAINGDHIVDFSDSSLPNNMIDFIALGDQGLDTAKNLIDNSENKIELSKAHLEAPITKPSKILAVGLNYKEHQDEVAQTAAKTIGKLKKNIQIYLISKIALLTVHTMIFIGLVLQNF